MFLSIQFPISDLRIVLNDTHKLLKPQWPNPDTGNSLRYFGKIEKRIRGGVHQWPGEQIYCNSKNAVTIDNLTDQKVFFNDTVFSKFTCTYRRFYSDGKFTNKFETGFKNNMEAIIQNDIFPELFKTTLDAFLNLKVKVKNSNHGDDELSLHEAGEKLAKLYLMGSTEYSALSGISDQNDWWVKCGDPVVLMVHEERADLKLPPHVRHIAAFPEQGVQLKYLWHRLKKNTFIKVWIITTDPSKKNNNTANFQRQLRINLLRINAEKEVLRNVLNNISSGRISLESNEKNRNTINSYLEDITSKILKKERFGIEQDGILNEALSSENIANEGDFETLLSQLEPLKNGYINQNVMKVKPQMSPYYSVFISHSSKDRDFSKKLHDQFKSSGIRCWFDEEHIRPGDKIRTQILKAINDVDKVLIVLSDASVTRDWINTELFRAREREIEEKIQVLFPIRLTSLEKLQEWTLFDDDRGTDLAKEIRAYYIPDFTDWKNDVSFLEQFNRVMNALIKPVNN